MKIAFITSRFPYPLEKGDKLRAYHQIKELSQHFRIHLISLSHTDIPTEYQAELLKYCDSVQVYNINLRSSLLHAFIAFLQLLPLQSGYFYRPEIRRKIRRWSEANTPDLVYCQLLRTARYAHGLKIPAVLDYQDCFSAGMDRRAKISRAPLKWLFKLEAALLKRYETICMTRFKQCTIISQSDRDLLSIRNKADVNIIPNGVDTEYFIPQNLEADIDILFTGNLSYPPNINAAEYLVEKILPLVRKQIPKVNVTLAGADPAAVVRALASEAVTVTGWVDDIRQVYARCRVFVAPMRIGTGLQNKLLEAMAMGKPCVTTSLANQSLGALPNQQIMVGDNAEGISAQILRILSDDSMASKLATKGHEFVKNRYSWSASAQLLADVMRKAKS